MNNALFLPSPFLRPFPIQSEHRFLRHENTSWIRYNTAQTPDRTLEEEGEGGGREILIASPEVTRGGRGIGLGVSEEGVSE